VCEVVHRSDPGTGNRLAKIHKEDVCGLAVLMTAPVLWHGGL
jgi:hypothetical protein